MSTYLERSIWRWIVTPIAGLAVACLGAAVFGQGWHSRLARSRRTAETSEEAALAVAVGAMANEGGPARSTS
jgi:hypothetical protein